MFVAGLVAPSSPWKSPTAQSEREKCRWPCWPSVARVAFPYGGNESPDQEVLTGKFCDSKEMGEAFIVVL